MFQASCPSCGAPVVFAHAHALSAVCERCRTWVVRTDREVESIGKVSAFDRDLSPVQLEAAGVVGNRRFRVLGVVRLGRERVRWNEWALGFEDGEVGWLGESNGQHWLFEDDGRPAPASAGGARQVGDRFRDGQDTWVVVEAGEARILAAEGSLWWRPPPTLRRAYADLRRIGGGVGTLDREGERPVLYAGRSVSLAELRMEGLRPVTGWDDPALTHFRGPELHAVQKLACPSCGADLDVKAGTLSSRVVCAYCGVPSDLEGGVAEAAGKREPRQARPIWEPQLPLGTKGRLRGADWQIVGAMERSVRAEGVRYPWTEYFLYNPWHGGAWLVEANGHWSFVELLADLPGSDVRSASFRGRSFRAFSKGRAAVDRVIGEFTWQVAVGERTDTLDLVDVDQGTMLSQERADGEETWSFGRYIDKAEVEAFTRKKLPPPRGVAPHQPNPYTGAVLTVNTLLAGAILALGVVLSVVLGAAAADDRTQIDFPPLAAGEVALADLVVPDVQRRDSTMNLTCSGAGDAAVVSLVHQAQGHVYEQSWTDGRTVDTEWRLEPGAYVVRLGMQTAATPATCRLVLTRDPPSGSPLLVAFVAAAAAVGLAYASRLGFESTRWQSSDFT